MALYRYENISLRIQKSDPPNSTLQTHTSQKDPSAFYPLQRNHDNLYLKCVTCVENTENPGHGSLSNIILRSWMRLHIPRTHRIFDTGLTRLIFGTVWDSVRLGAVEVY